MHFQSIHGDAIHGARAAPLDLAAELSREFEHFTQGKLGFSAGFALAKPGEHILSVSDRAAAALEHAKSDGRNRIQAFGEMMVWPDFQRTLRRAKDVTRNSSCCGPTT